MTSPYEELPEEVLRDLRVEFNRYRVRQDLEMKVLGSGGLEAEAISIVLEDLIGSDEDVFETFVDTHYEEFLEHVLRRYSHLFIKSEKSV